jgi:serine/threonine protein kinase
MGLATLVSQGIYNVRVVNHVPDHSIEGLIEVEEIPPQRAIPVAVYVSRFTSYNEKDCRAICRKIAQCIQTMHDAGLAHRNLHLANVEIDPSVRACVYCQTFGNEVLELICFHFSKSILGKHKYQRIELCTANIR